MKHWYLLLLVTLSFKGLTQPYAGTEKVKTKPSNILKGANCTPPTTTTYMEINNVRAMIHTAGNLWQVPNQNFSMYEVPKNSGIMALFTAALWLGGTDFNNQLKLAALRYRNGQDYWTGPLSKVFAETTYENCSKYDKHFITTQDDVREFSAWYQAGLADAANGTNTQAELFPNYKVPAIIKEWPAHGDVSQGQDYYLAPFYDFNEDGHYNWQDGDYPWHDITRTKECSIDRKVSLYGDLNYWWVMNDKGNIHTETGADPIGMEIRAQAFAFASNDEINNMTFYNYELINRGTQTLYNTYFGFFTDGALGDPYDDYVGCDVNRGLGYYYNGDNYDGDNSGFKGYGYSPPAVGVDFFEGPYQDNDGIDNAFGIWENEALNGIGFGDGVIDNERFGMRRFLYYSNTTNGANPNQTDPVYSGDYYNYLRGFWKDGTKFVYGGSGHISDPEADPNTPCDFMFPGNTDPQGWGTGGNPQANWTEQTANNTPNDRRFVQSAGPFILKPGAVNNITVGVVWARSSRRCSTRRLAGWSSATRMRSGRTRARWRTKGSSKAMILPPLVAGTATSGASATRNSRSSQKWLPPPGLSSTAMVPPSNSVSVLAMVVPRPVPPKRRVGPLSTCSKAWNRVALAESGTPMPVSAMRTCSRVPAAVRRRPRPARWNNARPR